MFYFLFFFRTYSSGLSRKPIDENNEKLPQQDAMKSDIKTFYDMIANLCGRPLPGIPSSAPVPIDVTERMKQYYWQHNVLLTFLKYIFRSIIIKMISCLFDFISHILRFSILFHYIKKVSITHSINSFD